MSRTDDIKLIASESGIQVGDLTPTPLTAPGVGPWVRCFGQRTGWAQTYMADVAGTADVTLEATTERIDGVEDTIVTYDQLTQAKRGRGAVVYAGPVWVRLRLSAIAGASNAVYGTIAWS